MPRFNSTLPKAQCAAKRSTLKNAFCLSLNKLCFEGVDSAYPSLACHLTRTFNYTPPVLQLCPVFVIYVSPLRRFREAGESKGHTIRVIREDVNCRGLFNQVGVALPKSN